jgi:hypothetical protein
MTDTASKRADRFPIPLKVYCSFERMEGFASITNISYTGALLEHTGMLPAIGTPIKLYLHLKPPCAFEAETPSELTGVASRHSSDGFAVEFEDSRDPGLRRMVDDAAAVVAVTR